jgi:hypothetical protein
LKKVFFSTHKRYCVKKNTHNGVFFLDFFFFVFEQNWRTARGFSDFFSAKYTVLRNSQKEVQKLAYCKNRVLFLKRFMCNMALKRHTPLVSKTRFFQIFFRTKLAYCKGIFGFFFCKIHGTEKFPERGPKTGLLQEPCSIFETLYV